MVKYNDYEVCIVVVLKSIKVLHYNKACLTTVDYVEPPVFHDTE